MPVNARSDGRAVWRRRSTRAELAAWAVWLLGIAFVVFCWRVMTEGTIWAFVWDAPTQAADIGSRMVPPRWSYLPVLLKPLWDTLNIATLGTLAAILLSVPVAFLAARNTTPSVALVRPLALLLIVTSRSINSIIWALLLVAILGPGVLAGIIAIALRSIGFIGKLLYEAIEEIDEAQVEAIRATGASGAQTLAFGIVPQIMPAFAGISVFRWDINIRESTVLGLVGAGGIGLNLESSLNTLAWPQVTLILLVILATVVLSEWVSAEVRHAII
ncbi:MAG: phosphonate ABC transporter, permease protein PhnE [Rhizobiales bacterium 32-66-8]|nr:MAG: phosphonate ABC transporter, permease protein PhnE [Rhizobiales bacterium 32-66-8]